MIGIDLQIDKLKTKLAAKFAAITTYVAYGRAYKNNKEAGVIPEVLTGVQYKDVLLDTKIAGLSFCIVENDYDPLSPTQLKNEVSLYFAVNLDTMYPLVTERAVEYLHRDVLEVIQSSRFEHINLTSGLESFGDFDLVKDSDNYQPNYLCKFSLEIEYNINEC